MTKKITSRPRKAPAKRKKVVKPKERQAICEPSRGIVNDLGGEIVVAEALNIDRSTVFRWSVKHPMGCDGKIPNRYWEEIEELGLKAGIADIRERLTESAFRHRRRQ